MKVFFGVVLCVLIYSPRLAIAEENNITSLTTITSTQPRKNNTVTARISGNCTEPSLPDCQNITSNKTFASVICDHKQNDEDCIPENISVSCVTLKEDNIYGWEWVKKNSSTVINVNNANNTSVTIENLSEFTNYTCNGILRMSDGQQIELTTFTINTTQEVSSEPLNLIVAGITRPKIISVKWEKPEKNPGIFESYQVHISSWGPNHFLPKNCREKETDTWDTTATESFTFENLYADYNYQISIFVKNSAGNGTETSLNETTLSAASTEPEDFRMEQPLLDINANVITGNIFWKMPCEPNGDISRYEIHLDGYYIVDNQILNRNTTFVDVTDPKENYSMKIELQPAFVYNIGIRANGENITGRFYNDTLLITEDNIPGVPRVDDITEIGPTFFVVHWDEPEQKSGNITGYTIEVVPLMPLYDRDEDRCSFQNETFSKELDGDQKTYNFTIGHPYYKYSVSITANTSKGAGEASVTFANTESSVPEKPTDLEFVLLDNNTSGLISWRVPCNVNGPLEMFNIRISGIYSDNSSLTTEETNSTQFKSGRYIYSFAVNLSEAYIYHVYISAVLKDKTYGEAETASVTTPDGYPGSPLIKNATEVEESSFAVTWEPPTEKTGSIKYYEINITSLGPLYETYCIKDLNSTIHVENGSTTMFKFTEGRPYYNYSISIIANTSKGFGNPSEEIFVITEQSIPETVEDIKSSTTLDETENYNASANISFKEPCHMNGLLTNYEINVLGSRPGYSDSRETFRKNNTSPFIFSLKPEYNYNFSIKTINERFNNTSNSYHFTSPAGVPQFYSNIMDLTINTGSSNAKITLKEEYFDKENGNIQFIALILSDENKTGGYYSSWNKPHWPNPTSENAVYYQLSKDWWNPFKDINTTTVDIGIETNCTETQTSCNKPLEKNKDYYLIVRIFTNNFYKNSPAIHFRTDDISKLGMILGIIFGLLAFAVFGLAVFCAWKRNIFKLPSFYPRKSSIKTSNTVNTAIPIYKFIQYCKNLENNAEKLSEQYSFLAEKTKEAVRMQTTVFAELTENRRKNRYTNILPYDETRVKLLIDEDDEIGSDYINASYIRGYSGKIEYIATQGPLPTTCRDFWKMVIQENVSIIVMVTQFIEQNKEKCYRYFPNNHESMIIGEDMEVKCSMELHFGTYCVRTLQVKKDTTQVTVTHMQYLDWPDFNVPKGTDNMLQFCYQLRERLKIEGGYVIIHCSAGVGRTGTLIATDILLQNVIAGKNIDVFNTVLELRKQRTHMVQTQKQYMYIHDLVKDYLDQSNSSGLNENIEPLYENLSVLKVKTDDNNLIAKDKETESQF